MGGILTSSLESNISWEKEFERCKRAIQEISKYITEKECNERQQSDNETAKEQIILS